MQAPVMRQACDGREDGPGPQAENWTFGEGQQVSKQELGYMSAGARENEGSVMNTKKVLSAQRWLTGSVLDMNT